MHIFHVFFLSARLKQFLFFILVFCVLFLWVFLEHVELESLPYGQMKNNLNNK